MANLGIFIRPPAAMAIKRHPAIALQGADQAAEGGATLLSNNLDAEVTLSAASKWLNGRERSFLSV